MSDLSPTEKEYMATALRNALDSLYFLRNFIPSDSATVVIDLEKMNTAIQGITSLRDDLTETYELPRWIDEWGSRRRWEHVLK